MLLSGYNRVRRTSKARTNGVLMFHLKVKRQEVLRFAFGKSFSPRRMPEKRHSPNRLGGGGTAHDFLADRLPNRSQTY